LFEIKQLLQHFIIALLLDSLRHTFKYSKLSLLQFPLVSDSGDSLRAFLSLCMITRAMQDAKTDAVVGMLSIFFPKQYMSIKIIALMDVGNPTLFKDYFAQFSKSTFAGL